MKAFGGEQEVCSRTTTSRLGQGLYLPLVLLSTQKRKTKKHLFSIFSEKIKFEIQNILTIPKLLLPRNYSITIISH